ncbi:adenylate/guanylate cyclase domain-containing protein [Phyllobacterium endophyticum]|uniref:Adenylate/guanylate cyclase domain-containing protein n=1 Tax=Phyllobacterium endophyticum TaxID=1149773 RepID=A0A2P7AP83_9HYPH|nr:adenylate/guanylate cyclase domain-containing protein [Phyllobacterium endophyticum]MBB3233632.1 adenylate cyclase [Phyllobacterium endophyticum]PSH56008.1 adenylate/guanylate cyclase domain-containing protein [Phyllobacterium endophyticum]TYR41155.1 tetratricopeptide repeat protein [Phyllobacterium endophyticum]
MERKLAAIIAGDIAGYSRLMAEDEAATYAELCSVLEDVIKPSVERHGGRIFKSTGDGFLAAFPSVNEALDAAIGIQSGFAKRRFRLRLGINLGDVIEDNGDVFGDGVNVASRLETIAEPGSIFVSEAVVRSADRSRSEHFCKIGRRHVKNIPQELEVYTVKLSGNEALALSRSPRVRHLLRRLMPYALGTAALLLVMAAIQAPGFVGMTGAIADKVAWLSGTTSVDGRPSVAVLPFDNLSGDAEQNYFADGLTEDVITELARTPELQVIARNSTFALRGQATDIREVGQKLGAGYVVEGSARRVGDQLRVVAQLIDTRSGAHLWSRSYDRDVADVFAVQTELTSEIVSHLVSYVRESEVAEAAQRPPQNLQAYDLVLQARNRYKHGAKDAEALLAARLLYHRALELDPGYAVARANLAMTYIVDMMQTVSGRATMADVEMGLSEARQAIRLDPNLAIGYQVLSFGLSASGDYSGAMQAARRAVELNPNDPDSLMALAKAQVRFGDYRDAVSHAERARRLHPIAPDYYTYVHGQALYAAGRLDEADNVIRECLLRAPQEVNCLLIRTALLAGRGEVAQAQVAMARLVQSNPKFSLAAERDYRRFGTSPLMDRFLQDLARAKAPETAARSNLTRERTPS